MTHHDVIVVGGGTGNNTASAAAAAGHDTLLVEEGKIGGTCLNRGCNPSKMVLAAANAVNDVREAEQFGVHASVDEVAFGDHVRYVTDTLSDIAQRMAEGKREEENLTLIQETARFVDSKEIVVDGDHHTADRVVIAAGTRPVIPGAIDGLDEVDYLTSTEALRLTEPPESLVVLGGGYIAAELGYYFESFGTQVTMIEMEDRLLPREDADVAAAYTEIARDRHDVFTGHRVTGVEPTDEGVRAHAETADGETVAVEAEELLVALGRRPNTDRLGLDETEIATDERGFVETDERLEASVDGVWAQGDIAGNHLFKHSGDYETEVVAANVAHDANRTVDYTAMPHAVFTEPQVAGVGPTEAELRDDGRDYVVGTSSFPDSSMGRALMLDEGLVKVLADAETGELLATHVFGHEASILVHEAVVAIRNGLTVESVAETIHVHPSLSKVMKAAFEDAASER
ncbi:MAG: NAD(P)/FAD-dependent oxidoreductase [Halobaculum sp.]